MVGLEKTACLIVRCTVYELLYTNRDSVASNHLEQSTLRLYTAILKFFAKVINILNGGYFQNKADHCSDEGFCNRQSSVLSGLRCSMLSRGTGARYRRCRLKGGG